MTTLLFTGDSVTDCHRLEDPDRLGTGYVRDIAAALDDTVINTGVGGNRVRDLRARWQQDVLAHDPDVVSILVGINDTWRRYDSADPTSTEAFETDYRWILEATVRPGRRCVLIEPFVLPVTEEQDRWLVEDLGAKLAVVRALASEFGATLVPTGDALTALAATEGAAALAADGVHPTVHGHEVIAELWLRYAG